MTATTTSRSALKDMTGQVFGELTVIQRAAANSGRQARWVCRCSCGVVVEVLGSVLRKGDRKSCGCKSPRGVSAPTPAPRKKPAVPKERRWVSERDGLVALVSSPRDEALVEFDMTRKAWVCSECGLVSCDHVAVAARDLPRAVAAQVVAAVAPRTAGPLSASTGGAKVGEDANQKALAIALAKSAAERAERVRAHDRLHEDVTSNVTVRKASPDDLERLRLARARKRNTFAPPLG